MIRIKSKWIGVLLILTVLLSAPLAAICGAAEPPKPTAQPGLRLPAKADGDAKRNDPKSDPQETTDLAIKKPKMLNELAAVLRQRIQRSGVTPCQKPALVAAS